MTGDPELKYEDLTYDEVEILIFKRLREVNETLREIRDLLRRLGGG